MGAGMSSGLKILDQHIFQFPICLFLSAFGYDLPLFVVSEVDFVSLFFPFS